MRTFIQERTSLSPDDKVTIEIAVPRMPFTKVRFEEFARVNEIRKYLIQDLFFKPDESLSALEREAVF